MKIEVVGNCCSSCQLTYNAIAKAAAEIDGSINVVHIKNITDILRLGIIQTPTIIIDGKIICSGKHFSKEEAIQLILEYKNKR